MFKKRFFTHDQFPYVVASFVSVVFLVMIFYFDFVQSQHLSEKFKSQAKGVEEELSYSFDYVQGRLFYIASDINIHKHYTEKQIVKLISGVSEDLKLRDILSSNKIRWVGLDDKVRNEEEGGLVKQSVSTSHEEILFRTKQIQDVLYFGSITRDPDNPQKRYLPAGIGIQNNKGNYIGSLIVEFSVPRLEDMVSSFVGVRYQQLYILHQDLIPVLSVPSSTFIDVSNEDVRKWLSESNSLGDNSKYFLDSSFLRIGQSLFLIKFDNLPFVFFIKDRKSLSFAEASLIIFENISGFLLIILASAVIFQAIRKGLVRTSLSNDYVIFASIATISATFVCIWLVWSVYQNEEFERNFEYQVETDRLADTIERQFDYAENLARFVGGKISKMPKSRRNLEEIADLLGVRPVKERSPYDIFSSTMLDFIDEKDFLVANGEFGVLEEPFKVEGRQYLIRSRIAPWKLHIVPPRIGNTSGEYVIPAGMGITDHTTNEHMGLITLGLNVKKLTRVLESTISSSNVSFMVLTKRLDPVIMSSDNKVEGDMKYLVDRLQYVFGAGGDAGFLEQPITYGDVEYGYYRETFKYPYIILVGRHKNIADAVFKNEILPRLIEVAGTWLFILVLLFFFQMKIVSPMSRLSQAASRLSQNKLDTKIPHGGSIEAFNLAKSLLKVKYSIRREQRLKKAIEKANQGKTDFLLATAHELRSPLNAIIGLADLIKSKKNVSKTEEYAQDIQEAGRELLEFISDLLDLNQAESGNFMIYRLEFINIGDLIKRSIKLNISRAQSAGIKIKSSVGDNLPKIKGSERRLKQVLVNLITNSIKYSPSNTVIQLSASEKKVRHKEGVEIVIEDQGFGMTEEELKVALLKWGRGDNHQNGAVDSFGLGLPLVKHLVGLHNGTMEIESNKGKGTKVCLWFPVDRSKKATSKA